MTDLERASQAVEDALASDDNHPDDIARAVLLAVREVSQEAYNAGWDAMNGEPDAGPGEPWLATIDFILNEPQP